MHGSPSLLCINNGINKINLWGEKKMKEYKLVYLNKGIKMSREKDLEQAQDIINEYINNGWELQQIVSPSDGIGALVGVFFKEKYSL